MPNKPRLVVTLTTIPSRISRIGPVVESLKAQTRKPDRIYVCLCERSLREQSPYDVPEWLRGDACVEVVVAKVDFGPATKLLGMLGREPDGSTRIVVVDDDWAYRDDMIETLERRFDELGEVAVGSSGARLTRRWTEMEVRVGPEIDARPQLPHQLVFVAESPQDLDVDILQLGFGAMLLRGWFGDDIYALVTPLSPLFFADDVLFSGYLESKQIRRVCLAGIPLPRRLEQSSTLPLHGDGRATRNYKSAIPTLAAHLGIWAPGTLFVPRAPILFRLRYWAMQAVRKTYRMAVRPLTMLVTPK